VLQKQTVVVGVCGGIAAYKAVEIVSRLRKLGADVHVIMTENASKFVAPLTFQSISHNPVVIDMFEKPVHWDIEHISLAQKADVFLVAPATANVIGKVAGGIADDMLTTTIMATKAPVVFAPAMNHNMYENVIVQRNIETLKSAGYFFIEPDKGLMACGTYGKGRLPEPEAIVRAVVNVLAGKKDISITETSCNDASDVGGKSDITDAQGEISQDMKGLRVLVTAGPTIEPIDPVRFITNRSSGKMGYAIASSASARGADVLLISGPVHIPSPENVRVVNVDTAQEMYDRVMEYYSDSDIMIFAAAVADYRCADIHSNKIKKNDDELSIRLVKNPDIAKEIGAVKGDRVHIGFSAETENLMDNAVKKLQSKNFDMIVANDVTMEGAGFGTDTNIVKIVSSDGSIRELGKMSKYDVAGEILNEALNILKRKKGK